MGQLRLHWPVRTPQSADTVFHPRFALTRISFMFMPFGGDDFDFVVCPDTPRGPSFDQRISFSVILRLSHHEWSKLPHYGIPASGEQMYSYLRKKMISLLKPLKLKNLKFSILHILKLETWKPVILKINIQKLTSKFKNLIKYVPFSKSHFSSVQISYFYNNKKK